MSVIKFKKISVICGVAMVFSGCATQGGGYNNPLGQMNTAEIFGTAIGAAAGAYGGSRIGHGATPYITGALGAAAGAWLGKSIASYLSESAQQQAAGATQQAAQSGRLQTWSDPQSGASGRAQVIRTSTSPQPTASNNTTQSKPCRTVEQTITLKDGSKRKEEVTACQTANGWEAI
jgi:surface antigen